MRKGSYRVYRERDVELVRLIKQSQQLGFSLAEIKQAVALNNQGIPWQVISQLITQKLQQLSEDILLLEQKRELLQRHQAAIQACLVDNPDCQRPLT